MKDLKEMSLTKIIVIGAIIIAIIKLLTGANDASGQVLDPLATGNACPSGTISIAKYDPALYDDNSFETGFEYGSEFVYVTKQRYDDEEEVIEINWQVARGANITYACMKIGAESFCLRDEYVPDVEYTLTSPNGQAISHIEWCQSGPTAVAISSFDSEGYGESVLSIVLAITSLLPDVIILFFVAKTAKNNKNI
jgi:hypothetical protein